MSKRGNSPSSRRADNPPVRTHAHKGITSICLVLCGLIVACCMVLGVSPSDSEDAGSTQAHLSTWGMKELASYTCTSSSATAAQTENYRIATLALNGKEVSQGAQFSFNTVLGAASQDEHSLDVSAQSDTGTISETDSQSTGIGQVSSALYAAALEAGLEVIERHAHTYAPDYAPLGFDAAVWYDDQDLIISNTTRNTVVIEASYSNSSVTVTLYGTPSSSGITYKASSHLVGSTPLDDNDTEQLCSVNTYRLVYKDNVCSDRILLYTDTYICSSLSEPVVSSVDI